MLFTQLNDGACKTYLIGVDSGDAEADPVVTISRSGGRSATAAAILTITGFTDVRSLDRGMRRWQQLGLPKTAP